MANNNDVNANVHINDDVVTIPRAEYEKLLSAVQTFRSMFSLYHTTWSEDNWGLKLFAGNKYQRALLKSVFEEEVDNDALFQNLMETCTPKESWEDTFYMYSRSNDSDRSSDSE